MQVSGFVYTDADRKGMAATKQIHLRVPPEQLSEIRDGAHIAKMSLTQFMLTASTALARNVRAQAEAK